MARDERDIIAVLRINRQRLRTLMAGASADDQPWLALVLRMVEFLIGHLEKHRTLPQPRDWTFDLALDLAFGLGAVVRDPKDPRIFHYTTAGVVTDEVEAPSVQRRKVS